MARVGDRVKPVPEPAWTKLQGRWKTEWVGERGPRAKAAAGSEQPPSQPMRTHARGVRLWRGQWDELGRLAKQRGVTVCVLLRYIISKWLEANQQPWAKTEVPAE